jgi:ribosomal protein S1
MSETGISREENVTKAFPVGSDVHVVVLDIDETGRRIRLSVKAIADAHEAAEVREYSERESAAPAESFGSLADKLRGALRPREE